MTAQIADPPTIATKNSGLASISVLACGAMLTLMQLYIVLPMLGGMQERYGMSGQVAAWVGAAFGLTFAVGALVFGPYSDGRDRRIVMAVGLVAVAASAVAVGFAGNVAVLLVARGIGGFFTAAFAPVALAYLGEVLEPRARPVGLAIVSGCFLLAGIAGQGYGLLGIEHVSQSILFSLTAILLIVVAVLVLRLPSAPVLGKASGPMGFLRTIRGLLVIPAIAAAYLCAVTILLSFVALYAGLSSIAESEFGLHSLSDLFLLRLMGVPGIVLGIFCGPLIRKWSPGRTGTAALLLASVAAALTSRSESLVSLGLSSALFMVGLGVAVPSVVAVVSVAGASARGVAMAGYGFLIGVGACGAPLLVNALTSAGFAVLCLVLAAALGVASCGLAIGTRTRT